jgi:hypothetical protein
MSDSMMNDFEESLYCTEVQVELSTPHCTPIGCRVVVDGESRSDEFLGNS